MSDQDGRAPLWMQVAGVVVGLLLGFVTAVWAVFTSPLYAGTVPLPVSPILAAVSNLALVWFTRRVTGRTGLALLPGVVWFGTMIVAASQTHAGDLLIPANDYMGLAAILVGCAAWGIGGYWAVLRQRPSVALVRPVPATKAAPAAKTAPATKSTPAAKTAPASKPAPGAKPGPKRRSGAKSAPGGGTGRSAEPSGQ
jgi:hypothetical protein